MSVHVLQPRGMYPAKKQPTLASHKVIEGWLEQGIQEGDCCIVRLGPVAPKQLIWLRARGYSFCSLLISIDRHGTITICGSDNREVRLTKFEYEIEGEVVAIQGRVMNLDKSSMPNRWNWVADHNSIIKPCEEWSRLTGHPPEAVNDFLSLVHPDDREINARKWIDAQAAKQTFNHTNRVLNASGAYVRLLNLAIPILDSSGNITNWVGLTQII